MLILIEKESGDPVVIDYGSIVRIESTWTDQYTVTMSFGKDIQIDNASFEKLIKALKTVTETSPAILIAE